MPLRCVGNRVTIERHLFLPLLAQFGLRLVFAAAQPKMRATRDDKKILILKTNMGAGHGGASGRYDRLHEFAFDYAFILNQVGMHD